MTVGSRVGCGLIMVQKLGSKFQFESKILSITSIVGGWGQILIWKSCLDLSIEVNPNQWIVLIFKCRGQVLGWISNPDSNVQFRVSGRKSGSGHGSNLRVYFKVCHRGCDAIQIALRSFTWSQVWDLQRMQGLFMKLRGSLACVDSKETFPCLKDRLGSSRENGGLSYHIRRVGPIWQLA